MWGDMISLIIYLLWMKTPVRYWVPDKRQDNRAHGQHCSPPWQKKARTYSQPPSLGSPWESHCSTGGPSPVSAVTGMTFIFPSFGVRGVVSCKQGNLEDFQKRYLKSALLYCNETLQTGGFSSRNFSLSPILDTGRLRSNHQKSRFLLRPCSSDLSAVVFLCLHMATSAYEAMS